MVYVLPKKELELNSFDCIIIDSYYKVLSRLSFRYSGTFTVPKSGINEVLWNKDALELCLQVNKW